MSHSPRGHHSQPPRTFGAVLWFPLARYARNPFLLLATTALPLIPGQLLGAYLLLRRTEDARVVDGQVLAAPEPLGSGSSTILANVELGPGWPADVVTLAGWVVGLSSGALLTAALLLGRRLDPRTVARVAVRSLPRLVLWTVVLLGFTAIALGAVGAGLISVFLLLSEGPAPNLSMLVWTLFGLLGLLGLVTLTPLLISLPFTALYGVTLPEGIGAAWLLARGRRTAHLLCLAPLGALLAVPGVVEHRLTEALAAEGTGLALGIALGVRTLLVLFLAPLPVLLLTGQTLWTPRARENDRAASTLGGPSGPVLIADRLDRLGADSDPWPHRPAVAVALAAVLLLVPLASGATLWANPHGTPGVTTRLLTQAEFEPLAEGRLPTAYGEPAPPAEVTRSDGRPLIGDRDEDVHLRDCRDADCTEWNTVSLAGGPVNQLHGPPGLAVDDQDRPRLAFVDGTNGMLTFLACVDPVCTTWETIGILDPYDLPLHMSNENPSGYAPVRVLSVDGERPELLLGRHLVTCADPLCGLTV